MEKQTYRNSRLPRRNTIPFWKLIISLYGLNQIRGDLGGAQEQKLQKIVKIVKNAYFRSSTYTDSGKKLLFKQVCFNETTTDRKKRFLGLSVKLTFLASMGSGQRVH